MSNFSRMTFHPRTGKIECAFWIDDKFGKHIYGVQFPSDGSVYHEDEVQPLSRDWVPHRPLTWTHRYASLVESVLMRHFTGRHENNQPVMDIRECQPGTRVKITMVSRLGDVGITDDLSVDRGNYGARVALEDLCDFGVDS